MTPTAANIGGARAAPARAMGDTEEETTMTSKLAGRVAVVTGGSAGIGLGIAKRFAEEGARVFITGRRQSRLDQAVASIGGDAAAIQGDSSDLADLDRIYATITAQAGRIDVLMVNAGVYEFGMLGEITEEQFDKTFNTDVRGVLFTVQKALPLLTKGSSVILTGSMVSIKGFASCSVYNASKGRGTLVCPDLDHRSQGARHPR